jgi:saccharopine dehydrogenase-like NADP-dependent oxidoreductase
VQYLIGRVIIQEANMKKLLVLGVGAQGSTVAMRLDEEPNVSEIICADYSKDAVDSLVKVLKKGTGKVVDGSRKEEIIAAAQGVDLIVNAMPLDFGKNVLEAALEVKANYQDFAAAENIVNTDNPEDDWVEGIKLMLTEYSDRFAAIGKTAVIGTGSAPGLICVVARRAVRELDVCDTINMLVYEGVEAKRFLPYWWSPLVALSDMTEEAYAFEKGEIIRPAPFSAPEKRRFPEMDGVEVTMVEHAHDEPVYMGLNSKEFFKGCGNIYFKYGGVGVDFAMPLYRAGLLSHRKENIKGADVAPFDVVLAHVPPAPRTSEEVREIIEEGLVSDTGAMVIEAYGRKDGRDVMVDVHVFAPGLVDSYKKAGLSAEMYLTGQGGYLFSKMFINDKYTQHGLISSDMLTDEQVDYYLECAAKLDITYSIEIR